MIRILQYQGISPVSKTIKRFTNGKYSHTAPMFDDGSLVEADWREGVVTSRNFRQRHTPGTVVDVFEVTIDYDEEVVTRWLFEQVGKGYDWGGIYGIAIRRNKQNEDKLFCSEKTHAGFKKGGAVLVNLPSWQVTPRDIGASIGINQIDQWVV